MKWNTEIYLYRQLTHWYYGVKSFRIVGNIQPVLTSKNRYGAIHCFICLRSAGWIQERIRQDCKHDVMFDVTGVTGCIFGFSDLQPGGAAPKSAIQRPSGTLTWRFLQARNREGQLHPQHVFCMMNRLFVNRLLVRSWLGVSADWWGKIMHNQASSIR